MDALRLLTQFPNIYLKRCKEKIYIFVDLRDQRGENRSSIVTTSIRNTLEDGFLFFVLEILERYITIYIYKKELEGERFPFRST